MITPLPTNQRKSTSTESDTEKILSQLTVDEKISLLSGTDFWHTASIPRLGVPAVRVSDGPNGVRGTKFFNGVPAACFPCGTALGATWDVDLLKTGGALQGQEAIAKGASAILGPTVNIQRSPLGGRGFESYSEDPVLSGVLSAATIRGIQSQGVQATLKHFVCNDQEDHRQSVNSIVTERALREIYLMPFQIAQRDAQPQAIMTAYNKVNGIHCSEDPKMLQDILRNEWAFDGLVMSDWLGTYSTIEAIKAGLDLEMPGPTVFRGQLVSRALTSGKLSHYQLDTCVRRILTFVKRAMALGLPEHAEEKKLDTPETSAMLRKTAADGIVLLKNNDNLLPLQATKKTAVIGPNAGVAAYCGGGSAALDAYYTISPLEGIRAQCSHTSYTLGAAGWKILPLLSNLSVTKSGRPGLDMNIYLQPRSAEKRELVDEIYMRHSNAAMMDYKNLKVQDYLFYADIEGTFTPDITGDYEFGVMVAGTAKLYVNGECVVDNETQQTHGESFFGTGTIEETGAINLIAGQTYDILVTFGSDPTTKMERPGVPTFGHGGVRIGIARKFDYQTELEEARKAAEEADQVVLCVGLNSEWESEGFDRPHMDLPPGSDELIRIVTAANPNTVVVVQSGTPVSMPWIDNAKSVIQAWYGGNECGNAIADIVFGAVNPNGKLPLTFPIRNRDNPAFLNYRSDRNRVLYGEDVFVGYRYYEATEKEVLFPFGHGLSYTTFEFPDLSLSVTSDAADDDKVTISTTVNNTGPCDGAQVVQVYIQQLPPLSSNGGSVLTVSRPVKELKAFSKVFLTSGESKSVSISFSKKYATSWWDEERGSWISEAGQYKILVGDSSASTPVSGLLGVDETTWWNGV